MFGPISYPFAATINGYKIREVQVGRHYLINHHSYMSDELILKLLEEMSGGFYEPESQTKGNFYYATHVTYLGKLYRVIWFYESYHYDVIGVINAYRVKKVKI
jgi:hypothetical protein